jgi:hypothetical protein
MIDWFCWLLLLVGLGLAIGSRTLHRRIGMPTAVWATIGVLIALIGILLFDS